MTIKTKPVKSFAIKEKPIITIEYLRLAYSAFFSLIVSQLSPNWFSLTNARFKQQVGWACELMLSFSDQIGYIHSHDLIEHERCAVTVHLLYCIEEEKS